MNEEEFDLLERFKHGSDEAFEEIVTEYQGPLMGFFFRLCWDRHKAEDMVQEVFMRLIRAAPRYESTGRLKTFIFKIAKNLWIDTVRKAHGSPKTYSLEKPVKEDQKGMGALIKGDSPNPAEAVIKEEERELLKESLKSLPETHRMVFELAVFQELPYKEIASILGIPVGTVKSRMFNSLRALKENLKKKRRGNQ